jgi:branched-chain amino acid transport system permease protein
VAAGWPVREALMSVSAAAEPHRYLEAQAQWRPIEFVFWLATLLPFWLFPAHLSLASQIAITALFALSLDLILGYAGIITLGHSAFFGLGAYTAGILGAKFGVTDPFLQLIAAAVMAALLGISTGAVILRTKALTLLMLTLAITSILLEIANKATWLTGGADGLSGVKTDPILGLFKFDIFGKTAFIYCLIALFLGWLLVRRLIYSPYGAMLTGIRENTARMHAVGAPVYWRLVLIYTLSATMAGVAGALLTQVNQFVGLNVLGLEPSGDLLVMLILGGVGRLYGAFVGPVVYLIAQDYLAKQYPEYWYFGIGVLLIVVVLFARGGILGLVDQCWQALSRQRSSARASAR